MSEDRVLRQSLTVRLAPDGPSLAQVLEEAVPHTTIALSEGDYELPSEGVTVRVPVTILGSGAERTRLFVYADEPEEAVDEDGEREEVWGLLIGEGGPATLVGLAVEFRCNADRSQVGGALVATYGDIDVRDCAFGPADAEGIWAGIGLAVSSDATGTVVSCRFRGNATGISIYDDAWPALVDNDVNANKEHGIYFEAGGESTVIRNRCYGNGHADIYVRDAGLSLVGNTCKGNRHGIFLDKQYGGSCFLHDNHCVSNQESGIYVDASMRRDQSSPASLLRNTCERNLDGVVFSGNGTAIGNRCSSNTMSGIRARKSAQPILMRNACQGNLAGITFGDQAGGVAQANNCLSNTQSGIEVGYEARPSLLSNICTGNRWGLHFTDQGAGIADDNRCDANKVDGIHVSENAKPRIAGNQCHVNAVHGIAVDGHVGWRCVPQRLYGQRVAWGSGRPLCSPQPRR